VNGSEPIAKETPQSTRGCGQRDANSVKVNQNCLDLTDTDLQRRGQSPECGRGTT
jgi:hypothetical protein